MYAFYANGDAPCRSGLLAPDGVYEFAWYIDWLDFDGSTPDVSEFAIPGVACPNATPYAGDDDDGAAAAPERLLSMHNPRSLL